ncbi:MAG: methyltransferase [Dehalococcoidia bacterium]
MPEQSNTEFVGTFSSNHLLHLMLGVANTQLLKVVAELGIADLLSAGPLTVEYLASTCGAHPGSLCRVLRALAVQDIFAEVEAGKFALTPTAALLKSDAVQSLREYVILHAGIVQNAAWPQLLQTVRTGTPAFDATYGDNIYEFLRKHPADGEMFDLGMTSISRVDNAEIHSAWDFSPYSTVADVGGGRGLLLSSILAAYPQSRGILFDLPSVVEGAKEFIGSQDLDTRCQIIGGDFTVSVPQGCDLYIFKRIFTSESDERVVTALGNCRESMNRDGRVLTIEPNIGCEYGSLYDILMLAMTGGRLRDQQEYQKLFGQAGLEIARVVNTSSYLTIIESAPL